MDDISARSVSANFKQIRVTDPIYEIEAGIFDVVTFNVVWMCLASRKACLDTLKKSPGFFGRMDT